MSPNPADVRVVAVALVLVKSFSDFSFAIIVASFLNV